MEYGPGLPGTYSAYMEWQTRLPHSAETIGCLDVSHRCRHLTVCGDKQRVPANANVVCLCKQQAPESPVLENETGGIRAQKKS